MRINISVEVDTDELFKRLERFDELDRAKFDKLVLTEEFRANMAVCMLDDFYTMQETDCCTLAEGIFADAVYDYEDDEA